MATLSQTPASPQEILTEMAELGAARILSPICEDHHKKFLNTPAILRTFRKIRSEIGLQKEPPKLVTEYFSHAARRYAALRYKPTVAEIVKQLGPTPKDSLTTTVIPVAAHEEGENLYTTLQCFTNQTLDHTQFDIALFLNYPHQFPGCLEQTRDALRQFRSDYPEVQVRDSLLELEEPQQTIGFIRKVVTDAACYTLSYTDLPVMDLWKHVLVRMDADTKFVHPEHLQKSVRTLHCNPTIQFISGKLDWQPERLANNPYLLFGIRLVQAFGSYIDHHFRIPIGGGGANFSCRMSTYLAADGYDAECTMGEDVVLGRAIRNLSSWIKYSSSKNVDGIRGSAATRIHTDTRRAEAAVSRRKAPYEQWDGDTNFQIIDPNIRSSKAAPSTTTDSLDSIFLERILENSLDQYSSRLGNDVELRRDLFALAQDLFGFTGYLNSDGGVHIQDLGSMENRLAQIKRNALRTALRASLPYRHEKKDGKKVQLNDPSVVTD